MVPLASITKPVPPPSLAPLPTKMVTTEGASSLKSSAGVLSCSFGFAVGTAADVCGASVATGPALAPGSPLADDEPDAVAAGAGLEIGRASCREREETAVVALAV